MSEEGSTDASADRAAADALYEEAIAVEERDGKARAIPVYLEVVRATARSPDEGMRALHAGALSVVAELEHEVGNTAAGRYAAEQVVRDYLDAPPDGALEWVLAAAFQLAQLLEEARETDAVIRLMESVLERHGEDRRIAAAGRTVLGRVMFAKGDTASAFRLLDEAVDLLGDIGDEQTRIALSERYGRITLLEALAAEADFFYRTGQFAAGDTRSERIIKIFTRWSADPDVGTTIRWARECIARTAQLERPRRRWFRRWG